MKSIDIVREISDKGSIRRLLDMQKASFKLHDVLSSRWRCETPQEHYVNICLDENLSYVPESENVCFELAWTCPTQISLPNQTTAPLRLFVETLSDAKLYPVRKSSTPGSGDKLEMALEATLRRASITRVEPTPAEAEVDPLPSAIEAILPDLFNIPNLCQHLKREVDDPKPANCAGFLQKTKMYRHLIYAPPRDAIETVDVKNLEEALLTAKAYNFFIPLMEKLKLAKSLAQAVLRFHSTPWLTCEWRSQDITFFGIQDFENDPFVPFLRTRVSVKSSSEDEQMATMQKALSSRITTHVQTPAPNQTLFGLGVMLIELAYDSPLQGLQKPEDDKGDPYTLYWTARRLVETLSRRLGPRYEDAAKICLFGRFGASSNLAESDVQEAYFTNVVQKLEKLVVDVGN